MGAAVSSRARDFLTRLWSLENDDRPGALIGFVGPRRSRGGTPVRSALFSTEGKDMVKARLLDPRSSWPSSRRSRDNGSSTPLF